jgi:hypothetical protein
MKRWFRKFFRQPKSLPAPSCEWLEVGPENPFNVRVLDVRPLTQTVTSMTENRDIAKSFVDLRQCDGSRLLKIEIEGVVRVPCELSLPFGNGLSEGPIFKASEMEDKWDIYVYDSVFYFARSWAGNLIYRAPFRFNDGVVRISAIESSPGHVQKADQTVYFLLVSHVLGQSFPNPIPDETENDAEQIAWQSFASFGRKSICATYSDVTAVSLAIS